MTREALVAHTKLIQKLRNMTCTSVGLGYASALLLDFGVASPPDSTGYREPELSLVVECPWRLENEDSVLAGSGDEDDVIVDAIQPLLHHDVEVIDVLQPSFTVRITFFGNLVLWVFPDDSRSYETVADFPTSPWYVTGRGIPSGW